MGSVPPCGGCGRQRPESKRVKVPCRQLPGIGRLAYPTCEEATTHTVLGSKRHGCHVTNKITAVGTTWVASKPGGLNIKKSAAPKLVPVLKSLHGMWLSADLLPRWGRPMLWRKKRVNALQRQPGYRSKHLVGKDSRKRNVGKVLKTSSGWSKLPRLTSELTKRSW